MKNPIIERLEGKIAKRDRQLEAARDKIQALERENLELRDAIRRAARVDRPGEHEK